jgi:hypothetical protein
MSERRSVRRVAEFEVGDQIIPSPGIGQFHRHVLSAAPCRAAQAEMSANRPVALNVVASLSEIPYTS